MLACETVHATHEECGVHEWRQGGHIKALSRVYGENVDACGVRHVRTICADDMDTAHVPFPPQPPVLCHLSGFVQVKIRSQTWAVVRRIH